MLNHPPVPCGDDLLKLPEASRYISRHPSYLRLVARREIRHYKIGGRLRFDVHDLDRLIRASRIEVI